MKKIKLKRELSLFEATLCGIGIILGVGIYALIGQAVGMAGNATWIAFLIGAIIAAFTGLSYAELASIFPRAGAEYVYTEKSFGKRMAFLIGWMIIIGGMLSAATVTLGFAGYFNSIFHAPIIPISIAVIIILSLINFYGVKLSALFAVFLTFVEAIGLMIVIAVCLPFFGNVDYFAMPGGTLGLFQAAALIFFAYLGFEEITRLAEETKKPEKNIPKALIIAIIITTVLYILVAISVVSVLGWEALQGSDAPLADVVTKAFGEDAFLIVALIALFATANTALLIILATSRILYGMAADDSFPKFLAEVHPKTKTPWVAIFITMILSMVFIGLGDIKFVANATNFTVFITFITINAALIYLRYSKPNIHRPFKVPINIGKFPVLPALGIVTCILLLLNLGADVILSGIALILIGLGFYYLIKRK